MSESDAVSTRWIAAVVVAAAFVAGVLVGVAGAHFFLLHHRPRVPHRAAHFMVERLDRRLDLSDEQEKKIEAIIQRRHERMNAIWSESRPRVRAEIEAANAEIAQVLSPEQRTKFEALKMRMEGGRPPGRFRGGE